VRTPLKGELGAALVRVFPLLVTAGAVGLIAFSLLRPIGNDIGAALQASTQGWLGDTAPVLAGGAATIVGGFLAVWYRDRRDHIRRRRVSSRLLAEDIEHLMAMCWTRLDFPAPPGKRLVRSISAAVWEENKTVFAESKSVHDFDTLTWAYAAVQTAFHGPAGARLRDEEQGELQGEDIRFALDSLRDAYSLVGIFAGYTPDEIQQKLDWRETLAIAEPELSG
jgi:hypothetical protein